MQLYQQQEEEFLHYANSVRRNGDRRDTVDSNTHACHGLQCLLALTKLLEEVANQKILVPTVNKPLSMEKDCITLAELRRHAEKLVSSIKLIVVTKIIRQIHYKQKVQNIIFKIK